MKIITLIFLLALLSQSSSATTFVLANASSRDDKICFSPVWGGDAQPWKCAPPSARIKYNTYLNKLRGIYLRFENNKYYHVDLNPMDIPITQLNLEIQVKHDGTLVIGKKAVNVKTIEVSSNSLPKNLK